MPNKYKKKHLTQQNTTKHININNLIRKTSQEGLKKFLIALLSAEIKADNLYNNFDGHSGYHQYRDFYDSAHNPSSSPSAEIAIQVKSLRGY